MAVHHPHLFCGNGHRRKNSLLSVPSQFRSHHSRLETPGTKIHACVKEFDSLRNNQSSTLLGATGREPYFCSNQSGRVVMHRSYPSSLLQIMIFLSATLSSFAAQADYVQTNLVSDISGFATFTDPMLKNPWGMSFSPKSPFWISDQGTNVATLYSVTVEP